MKRLFIASLLTLAAGTAAANQPFEFQRQIGAEEYVHGYDARHLAFPAVTGTTLPASLETAVLAADVDGVAAFGRATDIQPSGPGRISLWEIQRGSSEGIAYRQYHERYPVDTDWDAVKRDFQTLSADQSVVCKAPDDATRS